MRTAWLSDQNRCSEKKSTKRGWTSEKEKSRSGEAVGADAFDTLKAGHRW